MADTTVATRPPPATASAPDTGWGQQPPSDDEAASSNVTRWLWIWITIGALVVVVVIGFLIGISNALASIDDNLLEAQQAVAGGQEAPGALQDVEPLPGQVQNVNASLGGIDQQLQPVPGQADQIIANLTSVRDALRSVDGSLGDTSGTLQATAGSLADTSGVLGDVQALAGNIEATLESAQSPPDDLGTSDIFPRVATANDVLGPVRSDTSNIVPQLNQTNQHLTSVCEALPLPGNC